MSELKDKTVGVPCPNPGCGHEIQIRLLDLNAGHEEKCPACGAVAKVGPGATAGKDVKKIDEALDRLKALSRKLGR